MCAWPAARRWWRSLYAYPAVRLMSRLRHRPPWAPSPWDDIKDQFAWWLEKVLTCWLGRHHAKMDSWPFCYRCGKRIGR